MEKRKKITSKIIGVISIIAVVLSVFAVSVSASDVYIGTDTPDMLTSTIPLESISYESVVASNIPAENVHLLVENPFVFYDYRIDEFREGKTGSVTNYPYQNGTYTNTGRTIYYEFELFPDEGPNARVHQPLMYYNGDVALVPSNAAKTVYRFGNFGLLKGVSDSFKITHTRDTAGTTGIYQSRYRVTVTYNDYLDDSKTEYVSRIRTWNYSSYSDTASYTINYDVIASLIGSDDDFICVESLIIEYIPFMSNNTIYPPNENNRVVATDFEFSLDTYNDIYLRYSAWYKEHPIIKPEFVGIGDISFTDWLESAIGGFFDFEIVPNLSLGGILIVFVAVGIFMLLIRIFKG